MIAILESIIKYREIYEQWNSLFCDFSQLFSVKFSYKNPPAKRVDKHHASA